MRKTAVAALLALAVSGCTRTPSGRSAAHLDRARLDQAQAFLQRARETADPTYYVKADALLSGQPDEADVLVARGTLALARHQFALAHRIGHQAVDLAPANPGAWGVVADASNELGRLDEALDATQRMVDLKPDLRSLSRVSYARELRGDLGGAVIAMAQAAAAGGTTGENVAYVDVLLGQLLLTTGDQAGAEEALAAADRAFPGYPAAMAGRARLLVSRGRYSQAAALLEQVVKVQPAAEHVIAWGDALLADRRPAEAKKAYDLVGAIQRLAVANGVDVDLEAALFDADHSPGPAAVSRARGALSKRPSSAGHDVLAWNLYAVGQLDEAWREAQAALSIGTHDPQIRLHAAVIALERGDRHAATKSMQIVLSTNPRFSAVQADRVAATAAALGLAVPIHEGSTP
jgi:tetratricopeptide (TPR) repeat protein